MSKDFSRLKRFLFIVILLVFVGSFAGCSELGVNRDDLIFLFFFVVIHGVISFLLYLVNPWACIIGAFFQVYMAFNASSAVILSPQWIVDHSLITIYPDIHMKFMLF